MRIAQEEIDRIKRDVSIEQFLINPKRQGGFLVACCPLPGHEDRSPSFRYNLAEGWWKCMGCGRGGSDVLKFACTYWDLSWPKDFPLVLERLGARPVPGAATAYLPPAIKAVQARAEAVPQLPDAATIGVYRVAAEVWAANLWRPVNSDALAYVRRRGVPDVLICEEGIGFSNDTLAQELSARGLSVETAQRQGLLRRDGHETFAGRITLMEWRVIDGVWTPVWITARLCGDGAAWDDTRKYLNVRGERFVGGLDRARSASEVIVVEGAFDRLAVRSFGDAAVFLGSNQPSAGMIAELRALARSRHLILLADRDRAGRIGRLRTLAALDLSVAASVSFADLPRGCKDPGALVERPDGAVLYHTVKAGARRIDLARFKRLAAVCHTICQTRRAARCT